MDGLSWKAEVREAFIRRMSVDSKTNCVIFGMRSDGSTCQCYNGTDMQMVLQCFDDALEDYEKAQTLCKSGHYTCARLIHA